MWLGKCYFLKGWVKLSNILSEMKPACLLTCNRETALRGKGGRAAPGLPWASMQECGRQRLSLRSGSFLPLAAWASREASVFSHRWRRELQLEVLLLEDAVESRPALGASKRPATVATSVLGELRKESQLWRRGHM